MSDIERTYVYLFHDSSVQKEIVPGDEREIIVFLSSNFIILSKEQKAVLTKLSKSLTDVEISIFGGSHNSHVPISTIMEILEVFTPRYAPSPMKELRFFTPVGGFFSEWIDFIESTSKQFATLNELEWGQFPIVVKESNEEFPLDGLLCALSKNRVKICTLGNHFLKQVSAPSLLKFLGENSSVQAIIAQIKDNPIPDVLQDPILRNGIKAWKKMQGVVALSFEPSSASEVQCDVANFVRNCSFLSLIIIESKVDEKCVVFEDWMGFMLAAGVSKSRIKGCIIWKKMKLGTVEDWVIRMTQNGEGVNGWVKLLDQLLKWVDTYGIKERNDITCLKKSITCTPRKKSNKTENQKIKFPPIPAFQGLVQQIVYNLIKACFEQNFHLSLISWGCDAHGEDHPLRFVEMFIKLNASQRFYLQPPCPIKNNLETTSKKDTPEEILMKSLIEHNDDLACLYHLVRSCPGLM